MIELGLGQHLGNRLAILILRPEGTMQGIGGKITQEGFFFWTDSEMKRLASLKKTSAQ